MPEKKNVSSGKTGKKKVLLVENIFQQLLEAVLSPAPVSQKTCYL